MAAKRSLGQHFLVDERIVARIGRALAPRPDEALLEIGPGRGALTADLLRRCDRMAAVELDATLVARLRARVAEDRLVLLERDVLRTPLRTVLKALGRADGERLVVAGNLPYNISKPIVQKLIQERDCVDRAVLMFQREVADRLTASPGTRRYAPLGVLAGFAFHIEPLFDVSPRCFSPAPRVLSTVTRWSAPHGPPLCHDDEKRLRLVLAASFARRRRTLRNNLKSALGDESRVEELLAAAEIDGSLRAEALAPAAFLRLASRWDLDALV